MSEANAGLASPVNKRTVSNLRWWICTLLFASTVINYIDRQTLALLAPELKRTYNWTNSDYSALGIAFRVAYSIGQTLFGRILDRVGTRRGLTGTVASYSVISVLTSLASGFKGFLSFRFLLGLSESGNWPGAAKAVSEWFPSRERALATAFFDSGSSIGGAIAPFIVLFVYGHFGLHAAFVVPGLLGFLWLMVWQRYYDSPKTHPLISPQERALIAGEEAGPENESPTEWRVLLRLPQTWGAIVARTFTDPVWFFIADWFPVYLISKGFSLTNSLISVWIPFVAADLGNFAGGAISGALIARGWSLGWARKAVVIFGGCGVLAIIPTIFARNLAPVTALFAIATFSYGCFTTIANVLPSDLFARRSVASVSGMGGTGASLGTIVAFFLIGKLTDARSATGTHVFDPVMVIAGLIPFVGMILVLLLVRNTPATDRGEVARI
jgi:MFS transporter, ACS family, hexuronate transporter